MRKIFTLLTVLLVAIFAKAETETLGTPSADRGVLITKSITTAADMMTASKSGNYVKMRTNQNGNTWTFTVNAGYVVKGIKIEGYSNNSLAVATIDMTSLKANDVEQLSGNKTFGVGSGAAATICDLTFANEITRDQTIVCTFDNSNINSTSGSKNAQVMAIITITYEEATGGKNMTTLTPSASFFKFESKEAASQKVTVNTASDGALSYASSDEKVVTVSADGTIQPVGVGTATITITSAESDTYYAGEATVQASVFTTDIEATKSVSFDDGMTGDDDYFELEETGDGIETNYNAAYVGTYNETAYAKGLKLQNGTTIKFTNEEACDLIVVQSIARNPKNLIKVDGNTFAHDYGTAQYYYDDVDNNVRIYTYKNLAAGEHAIVRTAELGVLYVGTAPASAPEKTIVHEIAITTKTGCIPEVGQNFWERKSTQAECMAMISWPASIYVKAMHWRDREQTKMYESSAVCEAGQDYELYLSYGLNDGYELADEVTVTVDGKPARISKGYKEIYFDYSTGSTGINAVEAAKKSLVTKKATKNGIIVERNGKKYNVAGQQM